jgi:hypothetical protein
MTIDLFAGVPVRDYTSAAAWYERLLGAPPSFLPNDTEGDFDARISQIAERGLEPAERETYANGVRKATFRDPDGNEIGFGGAPA